MLSVVSIYIVVYLAIVRTLWLKFQVVLVDERSVLIGIDMGGGSTGRGRLGTSEWQSAADYWWRATAVTRPWLLPRSHMHVSGWSEV
jgi:hypothetical protein